MAALTRIYLSLFPLLAFAPLIIAVAAMLTMLRISRHRWVGHGLTFVALIITFPVYVWLQGVLDPTMIDYPGPGDGFVLLLYAFCLGPAALMYCAYAWLTRRKGRELRVQSAEQG